MVTPQVQSSCGGRRDKSRGSTIQVSMREFHVHLHLNNFRVKFLSCIKKFKKKNKKKKNIFWVLNIDYIINEKKNFNIELYVKEKKCYFMC